MSIYHINEIHLFVNTFFHGQLSDSPHLGSKRKPVNGDNISSFLIPAAPNVPAGP